MPTGKPNSEPGFTSGASPARQRTTDAHKSNIPHDGDTTTKSMPSLLNQAVAAWRGKITNKLKTFNFYSISLLCLIAYVLHWLTIAIPQQKPMSGKLSSMDHWQLAPARATTLARHAKMAILVTGEQLLHYYTVLAYVRIIWLVHIFCTEEDEAANDCTYVPKSKQWKWARRTKAATTSLLNSIGHTLNNALETSRHTQQRRVNAKYLHRTKRRRTRVAKRTNRAHKYMNYITMMSSIMIMQAHEAKATERMQTFDTDSKLLGIDNRATACISHDPNDFEGQLTKVQRTIKGFGGNRHFDVYQGTIKWKWEDDDGKIHSFRIPDSYYVPDGKCRLLSPQHWARTQRDNTPHRHGTKSSTYGDSITLTWGQRKHRRSVQLDKATNVATFHLAPGYKTFRAYCAECNLDPHQEDKDPLIASETHVIPDEDEEQGTVPYIPPTNPWTSDNMPDTPHPVEMNTSPDVSPGITKNGIPIVEPEAEEGPPPDSSYEALLLYFHQIFGHISFQRLRAMAANGIIPKRLATCKTPACSACMFAKATRKPWRGKPRMGHQPARTLDPGEVVSVDQMVSPTPGLIAQTTGILTIKRYKYATVFVDQATRYGYVHLQKTATADETIEAKKAFEAKLATFGVLVKGYHADNGVFKANKWRDACARENQTLTFSGVNAHHTNGMAEKRIRDLQDLTRTQLIFAARRWPKAITPNLWPYPLLMASESLNNSPQPWDSARRTATQMIGKTTVNINAKHYKPFGCPCYVLANALQQNNPYHKWRERAKVGIYLGPSAQHGRNVALVLDRKTGLVSPQFHVNFDPTFKVVSQDNFTSEWQFKAGFVAQREKTATSQKATSQTGATSPPSKPPNASTEGASATEGARAPSTEGAPAPKKQLKGKRKRASAKTGKAQPRSNKPKRRVTLRGISRTPTGENTAVTSGASHTSNHQASPEMEPVEPSAGGSTATGTNTSPEHTPRTSTSPSQPNLIEAANSEITHKRVSDKHVAGEIFCYSALCPDGDMHVKSLADPLYAYKASADPDTLYHHQAMKEPDHAEFSDAMQLEYSNRLDEKTYSVIHKSKVPKGATVLPTVWQLRRKRDIKTRNVKKYKARLNLDGSRMIKGTHYDQSYAPVASWNSIRTLLTLTAINGWHTKQLDYVAAFPQAPIERELYMRIPPGINAGIKGNPKDHVLKLHRNIYGQKQAGRVWNKYLVRKLIKEVGFTQSKVDNCVFYHGKVMYVLYTDDSILAGPDPDEIDKIIAKMKRAKLDITIEGDLEDFLGVNIDRKEDGTIHLTQPHLIDTILKDLNLLGEKVKPKDTPAASSRILGSHSNSEDFDKNFNYRSVIGKLNYLERGSRSDIAYITHQCARFTSCPKKEHGNAIRWLGRYLLNTRDKGLILKPDKSKTFEVWVDADFSGNFDRSDTENRDTARSRHGYYIMYQGCPITWKSQLQTEITLSSTESEYTGLSYALRETIPIMETLREMKQYGFKIPHTTPDVKCEVFEDNSGALEMARTHKFRPRTKHINVKLHHFRDYVSRGDIKITKVDTKDQLADILTKPVPIEILQPLRKKVLGW